MYLIYSTEVSLFPIYSTRTLMPLSQDGTSLTFRTSMDRVLALATIHEGPRNPWKKTSCPLKMGPIGRSQTSVQNYHSTLRNISGERRSHVHHGGSLKSWMWFVRDNWGHLTKCSLYKRLQVATIIKQHIHYTGFGFRSSGIRHGVTG
jgi:hypothetical protein